MKSIRTEPLNHAAEGDERIRTAVCAPSTDPAYEALRPGHERRGCVEIRWSEGDPDDVVAPWPRSLDGTPVTVHVERMDDGNVWMAIYDRATDTDVHMWFRAAKKGVLEWTARSC